LYRNYDGQDSAFGNTSVSTAVPNPDQVSAFSAVRGADGALTIMVVNKNLYSASNPGATTSITLNVGNFAAGPLPRWQLAAINPSDQTHASISRLSDLTLSGGSLTVSVPMQSVTLFVLRPGGTVQVPAAPGNLSAAAGTGQVALSWSASPGAASYNVYRATS